MKRATFSLLLGVSLVARAWGQQPPAQEVQDLASELPRIAATEPGPALAGFVLREGFTLLPAAVEPEVADPVSACYDADGRLYVVEMRGYPFPEPRPTGKVRLLTDGDSDGRFEGSTFFLDDLNWPTSVVPYDGGVFVMAPPDLYYARDDDGDGRADTRKVVFRGFGTQNVQALANGLLWGPDGWIYGVGAGNGGEIKNLTHPELAEVSIRGRDFRFRPDGSKFEAINGGGQFGHTFDDWGHRFTSSNSNHIRQVVFPTDELARNPALGGVPVIIDIGAEGAAAPVFRISGAEPWRIVRTRQRAADPDFRRRLPPTELVATGFFTSATGVTIYRGTAFPEEYRGNAFIGDVGGNLVHRKRMEADGAIYRAVRTEEGREFLASPDNWFRPVNFTNTPWGTLLLLDMYRETIEHPLSIPEPIKQHLDLVSGKNRGRLYELLPEGFERREKPSLGEASVAELVGHLGDPDAWWRETAQRLLVEREDLSCLAMLRDVVKEPKNSLASLHAIWTLGALGELKPVEVLAGLGDERPEVREAACRVVLGHPEVAADGQVGEMVAGLAKDPNAMVRFAAALALGEVAGEEEAIEALASIAVEDAGDRWTRAAVQSSLGKRISAGSLLAKLNRRQGFLECDRGRVWIDELAALIGAGKDRQEISKLLVEFAGEGSSPRVMRALVLGLGRGLSRSGQRLGVVLEEGPAREVLGSLLDEAEREVAGEETNPGDAIGGVEILTQGEPARAMRVLPGLLEARRPAAVQLAAIKALGGLKESAVADEIISRWAVLGPAARAEATEVLLARPERAKALLEAVAAGTIARAELDPARKTQLLASTNAGLQAQAKEVLGEQVRTERATVLAAFAPALTLPASAERGKEVFLKVCATCHQAEGQGVAVGPDLATVSNRAPEDLMLHILDPNREVAPVYLNYTVATSDGRVLSGMIAEETASGLTLKRAQGVVDLVPRGQIEEMRSTGMSLMPENLETLVDAQGLADLISYVRGVKAEAQAVGR